MQSLLGYVPRNGTAGLYRGSLLSFLRPLETDFHSNLTRLAFPPAVCKGSFPPPHLTVFTIACFLFFSFLVGFFFW